MGYRVLSRPVPEYVNDSMRTKNVSQINVSKIHSSFLGCSLSRSPHLGRPNILCCYGGEVAVEVAAGAKTPRRILTEQYFRRPRKMLTTLFKAQNTVGGKTGKILDAAPLASGTSCGGTTSRVPAQKMTCG